jgi:hypothetical protein
MRKRVKTVNDQPISRRRYLTLRALMDTGVPIFQAVEAVASTAIEHPEWDMDEEKTWAEWESLMG